MPVSTIDGTLESATVKRKASRIWRLTDVTFRKADGSLEALPGAVLTTPYIGEMLKPGLSGRFYTFRSIDHGGIHAVRPAGGGVTAQFPGFNEKLMAILVFVNIAVVALVYAVDQRPFWLSVALIPFSAVLWFLYREPRMEAEAQVAAAGG